MTRRTHCKGCEVRREAVALFGGLNKYGYCIGCETADKDAERYWNTPMEPDNTDWTPSVEWSPEIAEAMRIPHGA